MKLLDLSKEKQECLIHSFLRFVYPLYCETGVNNYDYHIIGSCFPLAVGERIFIISTLHQVDIADGKRILVSSPDDTSKFLGVENESIARFPIYDLAIFEVSSEEQELFLRHLMPLDLIKNLPEGIEAEYAVLGCLVELNVINHESKSIQVYKSALVTEMIEQTEHISKFTFSGRHLVISHSDNLDQLNSFHKKTQGLSGSPIIAFSITEAGDEDEEVELQFVGVSTHVAENDGVLYAIPPLQLVAALQYAYGIFPNFVENSE